MKWKTPPIIKIYEALGAVADERIKVSGNTAKVYSSSGNKYYDVAHDEETNAIMTNDNGSYWQGYLGYPAIAYLLATGVLLYKEELARFLRGIKWKDINQQFKNNFEKTRLHVVGAFGEEDRELLMVYTDEILARIRELDLSMLGKRTKPPTGY